MFSINSSVFGSVVARNSSCNANGVSFNAGDNGKNSLLFKTYTSKAGNIYYNSIAVPQQLVVVSDVMAGFAHTFLNRLRLQDANGKVLASRSYCCTPYNELILKGKSAEMLTDYLFNHKSLPMQIDKHLLYNICREVVENSLCVKS